MYGIFRGWRTPAPPLDRETIRVLRENNVHVPFDMANMHPIQYPFLMPDAAKSEGPAAGIPCNRVPDETACKVGAWSRLNGRPLPTNIHGAGRQISAMIGWADPSAAIR